MRSTREGLFTTHTVGELLWGYEDGLLKTIKTFIPEVDDVFGLFYKVSLNILSFILFGVDDYKMLKVTQLFNHTVTQK